MQARIAIAQLELAVGAVELNRERTSEAIRAASDQGAHLVVLPELASSGYGLPDWEQARDASEPIPGPTTDAWEQEASDHDCYVVGGICEREEDALFNSVALVAPDGVRGVYRKLHLFDREKLLFEPGDLGLPVLSLPFGRVGLAVCYDLRFFEVARILALQGADILAVPTAWTAGFDASLPSDGIIDQVRGAAVQCNTSQVFLAAASRVGAFDGERFLGSSVIVDPYGRFVFGPAGPSEEVIRVEPVDLSEARRSKVRSTLITPPADRRTDVYGELLGYSPTTWADRQRRKTSKRT